MQDDEFSSGKPQARQKEEVFCLRVVVEGEVQKVGYRNWMKSVCAEQKITGWVKNKSNGSVEAMMYGKESSVREVAAKCYNGSPLSQVKKVKEFPEEVLGTVPKDFVIAT